MTFFVEPKLDLIKWVAECPTVKNIFLGYEPTDKVKLQFANKNVVVLEKMVEIVKENE